MRDVQLRPSAHISGWGVYAASLLLMSAIVHAGTYLGRSSSISAPLFIGLHLGTIPVFIALVVRSRRWQRERRGPLGLRYRQLDWREWPFLPAWASRAIIVLGAYALANFVFSVVHLPLRETGTVLTEAQSIYVERMLSGHWLVFYALPLLYFTYVPRNTDPANVSASAAA